MSHLRNYCSVQSRQAAGVGLTRNSDTMTASILRLTELHVKILEQILLHFPGQDAIKMEVAVCSCHPTRSGIGFLMHGSDQSIIPGLIL